MRCNMNFCSGFIAALPRFLLLASILLAPLVAAHTLQAATDNFIEDKSKFASGAGLVLVVGLQRS